MSHPVDMASERMEGVQLPDVVYSLLIEKYFNQASCAAVAESGALDGFSPIYKTSRLSQTNYLALHLIELVLNLFFCFVSKAQEGLCHQ